MSFDISSSDKTLASIDNDESYSLSMTTDDTALFVNLTAPTYYGARHGLETASQLLRWDENSYSIVSAAWADV